MPGTNHRLTEFERSLVELGISAATAFSLPRSVGALFGLIFASAEPLALDDLVARLEISKGSASQGLKFLQRMGAIRPVYAPSERRTLYEPELSLRRLLMGVLNENVLPHLQRSGEQVARLREQLAELPEAQRAVLSKRLDAIESWGAKSRTLLPLIGRVFGAGALGGG